MDQKDVWRFIQKKRVMSRDQKDGDTGYVQRRALKDRDSKRGQKTPSQFRRGTLRRSKMPGSPELLRERCTKEMQVRILRLAR